MTLDISSCIVISIGNPDPSTYMALSDPTQHLLQFCQRSQEQGRWDNLDAALTKARTLWLRDWLQKNLPEILNLTDTPEAHALAREWDEKAKQMMSDR